MYHARVCARRCVKKGTVKSKPNTNIKGHREGADNHKPAEPSPSRPLDVELLSIPFARGILYFAMLLLAPCLMRPMNLSRSPAPQSLPRIPLLLIMYLSQVINGVLLPFVLVFMLILINDRALMGSYRNSPTFNVIAWAKWA